MLGFDLSMLFFGICFAMAAIIVNKTKEQKKSTPYSGQFKHQEKTKSSGALTMSILIELILLMFGFILLSLSLSRHYNQVHNKHSQLPTRTLWIFRGEVVMLYY